MFFGISTHKKNAANFLCEQHVRSWFIYIRLIIRLDQIDYFDLALFGNSLVFFSSFPVFFFIALLMIYNISTQSIRFFTSVIINYGVHSILIDQQL